MRQNGNLGFSLFHDDAFPFSNYPLSQQSQNICIYILKILIFLIKIFILIIISNLLMNIDLCVKFVDNVKFIYE